MSPLAAKLSLLDNTPNPKKNSDAVAQWKSVGFRIRRLRVRVPSALHLFSRHLL